VLILLALVVLGTVGFGIACEPTPPEEIGEQSQEQSQEQDQQQEQDQNQLQGQQQEQNTNIDNSNQNTNIINNQNKNENNNANLNTNNNNNVAVNENKITVKTTIINPINNQVMGIYSNMQCQEQVSNSESESIAKCPEGYVVCKGADGKEYYVPASTLQEDSTVNEEIPMETTGLPIGALTLGGVLVGGFAILSKYGLIK